MPIPDKVLSDNEWMFVKRRIGKQYKISLLPRKCFLSGRSIWFKRSIVTTSMITGPGDPVIETFWCDPTEFLMFEIKR
jgi:hypothetical protein